MAEARWGSALVAWPPRISAPADVVSWYKTALKQRGVNKSGQPFISEAAFLKFARAADYPDILAAKYNQLDGMLASKEKLAASESQAQGEPGELG